jgi:hypothetical protein
LGTEVCEKLKYGARFDCNEGQRRTEIERLVIKLGQTSTVTDN